MVTNFDRPAVDHFIARLYNNLANLGSESRPMLRVWNVDPKDYTLLDPGRGKGKMLLAALHGLRNVVGVEAAPGLQPVAAENTRKSQNGRSWARQSSAGCPHRQISAGAAGRAYRLFRAGAVDA